MTRSAAVALGYQGFGNVGDEAILAGIEELLRETPLDVRCVIAGDRAPVAAFSTADRVTQRRLLPSLAAARALRRASVLLVSGGGLIHDHWPIVIPRYLAWTITARLLGLRVAWVGVGVGPVRRSWARWLAAMTVRLAHVVTVRDQASAQLVLALVPASRVAVVPDPAFFLRQPLPSASRSGTAIIVRPPVPADARRAPVLAAALASLAARRTSEGRPVTILSMEAAHDDAFASEVADLAAAGGAARPKLERLPLEPAAALARLATFEEAVSVRLHGLILCALAGTPCVPIAYDDKVAGTAVQLGLAKVAVPLAQATGELLAERLAQAASGVMRATVGQAVERLRGEAPRVRELIAAVADV
ncbi:MAG: polysaccharide pyruvyl transferase family protein [Candidatus Limnocylindria bacterium]